MGTIGPQELSRLQDPSGHAGPLQPGWEEPGEGTLRHLQDLSHAVKPKAQDTCKRGAEVLLPSSALSLIRAPPPNTHGPAHSGYSADTC